jgi:hypothetical protein
MLVALYAAMFFQKNFFNLSTSRFLGLQKDQPICNSHRNFFKLLVRLDERIELVNCALTYPSVD